MSDDSSGECEVITSSGKCGSSTSSRRSRKLGIVQCVTHRSQKAKCGEYRKCGSCGLPIAAGEGRKKICQPCFDNGCMAITSVGRCGADLTDGRGGLVDAYVYCRRHRENPIYCDACGHLLPIGLGVGSFSEYGRWCSDLCQLEIKYWAMIDSSDIVQNEDFDWPCRVYRVLSEKGYPKMYGRFGGRSQVWQGHRIAYLYATAKTPDDILSLADLDIDHMCNVRGCIEPTHLQAIQRSDHMSLTWDRHTDIQRLRRLARQFMGGLDPDTEFETVYNGHRLILEPFNE